MLCCEWADGFQANATYFLTVTRFRVHRGAANHGRSRLFRRLKRGLRSRRPQECGRGTLRACATSGYRRSKTSGSRLRAELPAPRCRKYVALGFQAARSVKCGTPNRMPCHHVSLLLSPRLDHSRPAYRGRKPFTAVACEVAKMNFYLSAVNDLLRHPDDQLSIGPILFNWVSSGARQF